MLKVAKKVVSSSAMPDGRERGALLSISSVPCALAPVIIVRPTSNVIKNRFMLLLFIVLLCFDSIHTKRAIVHFIFPFDNITHKENGREIPQ